MVAKKKPVKKSGPSTGGKTTSRVRDKDSGNKKVPVTSVTPKITTPKASAKTMSETRKAAATAATLAIPAAKAARAVASVVAKSAAKKTAPGASKVINRTYKQGRDNIAVTPPKKSGAGAYSPVKGSVVSTQRTTRPQTPLQRATTTVGAKARQKTKTAITFAKGAAAGAYTTDRINKGKKKK